MYDSFDMACDDENTALRLNIKVNSENLLPTQQKYNLGSLRLPADPSWPKIPQRRLADDAGDLIQPPCIVTLTGTPRHSRTVVRVPQTQSPKLGVTKDSKNFSVYHYYQKAQHPQSQLPKRRSGCTDPRFKRVTAVKSQMTSTDPGEHEINKQTEINCSTVAASKECKPVGDDTVPWQDMTRAQVILHEAERPDETKGMESVGIQTVEKISSEITSDMQNSRIPEFHRSCSPTKSAQNQLISVTPRLGQSMQNRTPRNFVNDASSKNDHPHEGTKLRNHPSGLADKIPQTSTLQCCQAKEGQSLMAEAKIETKNHERTENVLDSMPGPNSPCTKQCCSVQLPVLSYQNVPVEVSVDPQSRIDVPLQLSDSPIFKNIEIPNLELSNDTVPQFSSGNTQGKPFFNPQIENMGTQLKFQPVVGQTVMASRKELNDLKLLEHTQFHNDKKYQPLAKCKNDTISPQRETKVKYVTNESNILPKLQMNANHRLQFKSNPEKLMKNIHNEEKCRPQQNTTNVFNNSVPKHNFHIYCHEDKPQCHAVITDSEPERFMNLIDQNHSSTDRLNRLTKNGNCVYFQQQTTDSESHVSDNMNRESTQAPNLGNKQKNYSQASTRLNATVFDSIDDHDNKNFQSSNHKCGYSEEIQTKTWGQDSKYKTLSIHEQSRATCLRQKRKMKSDQHLMLNKQRVPSSEPQITNGRRRSQTPYLKKANSYLSKCYTQQLTPDSESTYVHQYEQSKLMSKREQNESDTALDGSDLLQSSQHATQTDNIDFIDCKETRARVIPHPTDLNDVKREHCTKPYQRPSHKSAKMSSSLNLEKQNISFKSPRADTDVPTEKPTAIPVKTQQLLNKSYWEYYNRLKLHKMENGESPQQQYFCQVAMGAPQSKRRKAQRELVIEESNNTSQTGDQVELSLPEIRTLEQCSVLSTMINKTLDSALQPSFETIPTKQIYLNGNMRSSSDPTAGTQSAILKKLFPGDNEDSIVSSTLIYKQKHKRDTHVNNKSFKLKSIGEHPVVFFGCMLYAMIVFLPMIYEYFSYEVHDEYQDLSYVEIAFDYIIASFKEALGEFFDTMNKIFFKPDTRMQRLSSGRWRQKIPKHH